jgi:hypothetical protein
VDEHVAVPGTALNGEWLRFEDTDGLFEQGAQLGAVQQRRLPIGLGLVDTLARLGVTGLVADQARCVSEGGAVQVTSRRTTKRVPTRASTSP